jgi:putative endonuclease
MTSPDRIALGSAAEDAACAFLLARGLVLLGRNVRYRFGELDLVMREGATIVFVEVRRRRASRFGDGAASVDFRKRRRLMLAARAWLAARRGLANAPCRFDVASVREIDGELQVDWVRDAFSEH